MFGYYVYIYISLALTVALTPTTFAAAAARLGNLMGVVVGEERIVVYIILLFFLFFLKLSPCRTYLSFPLFFALWFVSFSTNSLFLSRYKINSVKNK